MSPVEFKHLRTQLMGPTHVKVISGGTLKVLELRSGKAQHAHGSTIHTGTTLDYKNQRLRVGNLVDGTYMVTSMLGYDQPGLRIPYSEFG